MIIVFILAMLVILYMAIIKKNFTHPVIYFFGIFCLPLLFSIIDLYKSMVEVSSTTVWVLLLGMLGFAIGTLPRIKLKIGSKTNRVHKNETLRYRKKMVYGVVTISFIFNVFMVITTFRFLARGYAYSSIRDLMFGYSGADDVFFKNSFLSTFNSWISVPCTYLVASLIVLEIFEKKFPWFLRIVMIMDVVMYVFASGGRLIVLTILVHGFFLMQYYKITIPKKLKKKVMKIGIVLVVMLVVITMYRAKTSELTTQKVNTVYAYFNIPLPILSNWIENTKTSGIYGFGYGFLNGFMELVSFLLGKVGIAIQSYQKVSEQLSLPQTKWIQIYNGHWYNAFCTLFYYFYVDFRLPGVFVESLLFGMFVKRYYRKVCIQKDKSYLPAYLTILQVITMAFIRWQFGTLAHIITMVLAVLCTKRGKKHE